MEIYLVGGAVRDELLNTKNKDRDWVVVNARPEQLLAQGYQQVGKDFPVFLHPQSREEYALATGMNRTWGAHVSLQDDLKRRDLTMNAIAKTQQGVYIDPFHGRDDIHDKIIRHVDETSFRQDPIRILRVARFAARYLPLGFRVAAETLSLIRRMVHDGLLDAWIPERVWAEIAKALLLPHAPQFFQVLRAGHALHKLLPPVDRLFGVPQSAKSHPEIDTGKHTMLVLQRACALSDQPEVRFAALLHDVGKGRTPQADWPRHPGHEASGLLAVQALCEQLKPPKSFIQLALLATQYHTQVHRLFQLTAEQIVTLLENVDAFRRPQRFVLLLTVCQADSQGRTGYEHAAYAQKPALSECLQRLLAIDMKAIVGDKQPHEIKSAVHQMRVALTAQIQKNWE